MIYTLKEKRLSQIEVGAAVFFIRHYKIFCVNGKYGVQV